MEKIFHGLMNAPHLQRAEKMKVVRMIEQSGKQVHAHDEVRAMLLATIPYWLNAGTTLDNVEISKALFITWSANDWLTMVETLCTELPGSVAGVGEKLEVLALCDLIGTSLELVEDNPPFGDLPGNENDSRFLAKSNTFYAVMSDIICNTVVSQAGTDARILATAAIFIADHPKIVPWQAPSSLLQSLILRLSKLVINAANFNPQEFIHQVNRVSRLIRNLWHKSPTPKLHILESLQTLFGIVSSTRETEAVSIALSSVLQSVPEVMVEGVCHNLIKDSKVSDAQMSNALIHMIDWLKWPKHLTIHTWIIRITRGLVKDGRLALLFEIIDEMAASIVSKLCYENIRLTTLSVLAPLLLYHQKCPQAFHKCIPTMLELFDSVQDKAMLSNLSELIQVLIYIHPGYPELYGALMSKLSDYEVLSEEHMQSVVDKYSVAEVSHSFSTLATSSPLMRQGDRVGMENLGNTCFLNAVVQALYNVDVLQADLLTTEFRHSPILHHLQRIFAFLNLTQRAAVDPSDFVRVGWPSWFVRGQQQDSSEYLRFLLDNIHEWFKSRQMQNDVTSYFTGSDTVNTRCHRCGTETQTNQRFNDISLHFPDSTASEPVTLLQLLENYSSTPEILSGHNQFFCDSCDGLQDATRTLSDICLPSCLVLTLCRFSYNLKLGKNVKLRTPVTYPSALQLKGKEYQLNAVIVHSGSSLDGGHYYTYSRGLVGVDQWYLFNDVRVTPCTSPSKLDTVYKNNRLSSDTPYILFYTHSATVSEKLKEPAIVCTSLRHLVVKDNLQLQRDLKMADQKKAARRKVCQTNNQSWYSYKDDDDDQLPPGANNSLDLSGSRFIY